MTKQAPGPRELHLREQREQRWAENQAAMKSAAAQEAAAAKPTSAIAPVPKAATKPPVKSRRSRASSKIGRSQGSRKKS